MPGDGMSANYSMLHEGAAHVDNAANNMGNAHRTLDALPRLGLFVFGTFDFVDNLSNAINSAHEEHLSNIRQNWVELDALNTHVVDLKNSLSHTDETNSSSINQGFEGTVN